MQISPADEVSTSHEWVDAAQEGIVQNLIFCRAEVYVHPTTEPTSWIPGFLSIIERPPGVLVVWTPRRALDQFGFQSLESQPLQSAPLVAQNATPVTQSPALLLNTYAISLGITEIHSLQKIVPSLGYSRLIITLCNGSSIPPFFFHDGGLKEFLTTLSEYCHLTRSPHDPTVLLVNDLSNRLSRTLSELHLSSMDAPYQPASSGSTTSSSHSVAQRNEQPEQVVREAGWNVLEQFAKVTQFARQTTAQLFDQQNRSRSRSPTRPSTSSATLPTTASPSSPTAAAIGRSSSATLPSSSSSPSSTPVSDTQLGVVASAETDIGSFDVLSTEDLRLNIARDACRLLTAERWIELYDGEGRIKEETEVRRSAFFWGIDNDIRSDVWCYLLGYYPFNSTEAEREQIRAQKRSEYAAIKAQWTSISPAQEAHFSKFRDRKHRVEKDVVRTDRTYSIYQDENSPHLAMLREILITYTFYDFDLGYVQGMSDLCSPLLAIIGDEVDTFWCFVGYMQRMRNNFSKDQRGMHQHLNNLRNLLKFCDPKLYRYLESKDSLNLFCCFRWLLINFKREFRFSQIMRLWEAIWSDYLTPHFQLFISVAILSAQREHIMSNDMDFDSILKYINDLSCTLDVDMVLRNAQRLYHKVSHVPNLPAEIQPLIHRVLQP